jgi:hypothetical protein
MAGADPRQPSFLVAGVPRAAPHRQPRAVNAPVRSGRSADYFRFSEKPQ